jgi:23S rRNA (adenine2503-C2)-methyltransferase
MTPAAALPSLFDLLPEEYPVGNAPAYRRAQIAEWLYRKRVSSFDAMTNLPAALREQLAASRSLHLPVEVRCLGSADTTRKYLWRLADGSLIESVLIPANPALYGERADRRTLCVSTQVGCAYGCRFCASGLDGWKRNLTPGEIVGQVLAAERASGERIDNLVFMGMGEPLANYDNLLQAVTLLNAPWGVGIGARHITISTSGLAPQIRRLADDRRQVRLALSLHGATDPVRDRIMPVNKRYPLAQLLDALAYYRDTTRQLLTFEFILIDGVNDSDDQARRLASLCREYRAKVNLIPYNTVDGLDWTRPSDDRIRAFAAIVTGGGATATVRLEKGHDIAAACGQLRLQTERSERSPE